MKPQPVSKLVARHLLTKGITLSTTNLEEVCPVAKPRIPDDPPKKLGEMSTDALNSALVALSALHFPEVALKPFRDVIEECTALAQQKVDNGKLLEQLTQAKHQKVKLRDAVKAEVDLLQQRLDARKKELADFEADVEKLLQRRAQIGGKPLPLPTPIGGLSGSQWQPPIGRDSEQLGQPAQLGQLGRPEQLGTRPPPQRPNAKFLRGPPRGPPVVRRVHSFGELEDEISPRARP